MIASLILTHDCNLRCTYCFAGRKVRDRMTAETGKRAIDFVLDGFDDEEVVLNFFGGEPLMCFPMIEELVAHANERNRECGKRLQFTATTNGTILTPKMIEFFKEHRFTFSLSVDGNEYSQNKCRRRPDGGDSYPLLERNLGLWRDLLHEGTMVTSRMTVDPANVDGLFASVRDLVDFGLDRIVFALNVSDDWEDSHIDVFEGEVGKIADLYVERMELGTPFYCANLEKYITRSSMHMLPGCQAAKGRISISPKGLIYPCHRFVNEHVDENVVIGDVLDGFNHKRAEFISRYDRADGCGSCLLVKRCGNVCPAINYQHNGDINKKHWLMCEHERIAIRVSDDVWARLKTNETFTSYMFGGKAVIGL